MALHEFFPDTEIKKKRRGFIPPSLPDTRILLSGPPHSGKTSLLLQLAFNLAKHTSGSVVFLCNRHRLESNPLFLSQDIDLSSGVFERILIKYVEDDEGLRKYFAAFHLHQDFPRAIIIDDFFELFNERKCINKHGQSRGRDMEIVRTLALCCDAVDHAKLRINLELNYMLQSLKGGGPCKLVISDTHTGDTPRILYIYKRWLTHILTIKALDSFTFTIRAMEGHINQVSDEFAKYTTSLQSLMLEELNSS